jgi:regulator of sigma E protease
MSILLFIVILLALILVHELGHFAVAKLFSIRVDEFGVGFPPRLFGIRRGETDYTVNALPFGGFVRIYGEDDSEASDPGADRDRSMAHKPRYAQVLVLAAGVFMNIVAAWLILSVGYVAGLPAAVGDYGLGEVTDAHVTVLGVAPGSPAEAAGLSAGK